MDRKTSWAVLLYGLLLIFLGWMGYQHGSKASLYAGGGFGFLLTLSAGAMFCRKRAGLYAAVVFTATLAVVFGVRAFLTGKSMPSALAGFSALFLIYLLLALRKRSNSHLA